MTNSGGSMAEPGEGERAEQTRSKRFWRTLAVLALAGAVIGALHSLLTGGDLSAGLPANWAIVLAAIWVGSLTIGSWYFHRMIDEVELRDNLWAGTVAVYAYCIAYPAWYFLWKGGVTPEPSHEALFIMTLLVMMAAYLAKKIRP